MSRSSPRKKRESIHSKNVEWKGSKGAFLCYDKATGKQSWIAVADFKVIQLDALITVTGFSDSKNTGIYANEVFYNSETLTVRTKDRAIIAEGPWSDIKPVVENAGGKWTQVIYALNPEREIVKVELCGSGIGNYFELRDEHDVESDLAIVVTGVTDDTKGSVKFKRPTFGVAKIPAEAVEAAREADKKVQAFLAKRQEPGAEPPSREAGPGDAAPPAPSTPSMEVPDNLDDLDEIQF